jgi:hypothetical protein
MLRDIIKYLVQLTVVTVGLFLGSQFVFDEYSSQSATLTKLWREDIENLNNSKILPAAIYNLREIEWIAPDKQARKWTKFLKPPFALKSSGEYRLELLILSQQDGALAAVIQHHLIHIPSGNSVWELGRTYTLPAQ